MVVYVFCVYWLCMCLVFRLFVMCPLCFQLTLSQLSLSLFRSALSSSAMALSFKVLAMSFVVRALSGCLGSRGSELPVFGFGHLGSEPHEHFGLPEHPQPPGAFPQGHL